METQEKTVINIGNTVAAPIARIWELWSSPEHITKWATPSDDWHTVRAENDLRAGGNFVSRMEAKDGSFGFDFGGIYDVVTPNEYIEYTLGDGRNVKIIFTQEEEGVRIDQSFDAETIHSVEMQQAGWQAILDNFKKYAEANS